MNNFSKTKLLFVAALVVSSTSACGLTKGPSTESETHFLRSCSGSCGDGLSCICGVCTQMCSDSSDCTELSSDSACLVSTIDCAQIANICDLECEVAEDCEGLANGAQCVHGRCRGREDSPDGGVSSRPLSNYRDSGELAASVLSPRDEEVTLGDFEEPTVDEEGRVSCGDRPIRDSYVPDGNLQSEARELLDQMSLDQKIVQLTGLGSPDYEDSGRWTDIYRSRDDDSLNLRGFTWHDGSHGLSLEAGPGRDELENYSTSFSTGAAQGASFDLDLVQRVGQAIADETLAAGYSVLMGPTLNLLRHPYWGRSQESFGEDSFHLGRTASAFARGSQQHIVSCAKHYLAQNIEAGRATNNSEMDEQTLREVYGRHFEMAVRDGGVGCVVASLNSVQGVKSTQNSHTLSDLLRNDMGFRGFTVSDWWSMPGPNSGWGPLGTEPEDRRVAAQAIEAGLNIEMPWAVNFEAIPTLIDDGELDESLVDRSVLRVLEQKLRFNSTYLDESFGLQDPASQYDEEVGSMRQTEDHLAIAEELAEKSMVLLRNEGNALPIDIEQVNKVAVLGAVVSYTVESDEPQDNVFDFARDVALGDRGSSRVLADPELSVGPFAGILAAAPDDVEVTFGSTAADAADADFIIVVVGLTPGDEGEEFTGASDRSELSLPAVHNDLIQEAIALGPPVAVIVQSGSAVSLPWINDVDAAIMAWYPGQRAGVAMGRLLFGEANFAARLPITWPRSADQLAAFSQGETTEMDYYVGYRRFDVMNLDPLFAYGHGLSYSQFRYEGLHIPCAEVSHNGVVEVEVELRNLAGPAGDEVVFVFASYPETQAKRSVKELKGFARISMDEGAEKRVTIPIRVQDLKYWDSELEAWVIEKGPVLFQVGPSSDNLIFGQTVIIN